MTKIVGYTRVSTGQQVEGVSLEAQAARLQAYVIAMGGLELVATVEEAGASGKTLERPGLRRALAMLDAGEAEGLLVVKLDRLTRSVRDLGDLLERYFSTRFSLLSVADSIDTRTASGRMVLNIMASIAQWERETTVERTKDALGHLRKTGVRLGAPALGWRRTDRLDADGRKVVEVDGAEVAALARMSTLRATGATYREIAAALAAEGHQTKRGGKWQDTTVRKVLLRAVSL